MFLCNAPAVLPPEVSMRRMIAALGREGISLRGIARAG